SAVRFLVDFSTPPELATPGIPMSNCHILCHVFSLKNKKPPAIPPAGLRKPCPAAPYALLPALAAAARPTQTCKCEGSTLNVHGSTPPSSPSRLSCTRD